MQKIDPERIQRAARIYGSNQEASRALGIASGSFSRLCRAYSIETPHARQQRRRQESQHRHLTRALLHPGLIREVQAPGLDPSEALAAAAELEQEGVLA